MDDIIAGALDKAHKIGDAAFVIFCHLYRLSDEEGIVIIPQRELAAMTGRSLTTVNNAIDKLQTADLITVRRVFRSVSVIQIYSFKFCNYGTPPTPPIESINSSNSSSIVLNIKTIEQRGEPIRGLTDLQALDMYMQVTGFPYVPPEKRDEIVGAIRAIHYSRNGDTVEYLRPFWNEAVKRYGKNTRLFWLSEWAIRGEISKGKKPPREEKFEEH